MTGDPWTWTDTFSRTDAVPLGDRRRMHGQPEHSGPECPWCRTCGSCDAGLPMSCTCGPCECPEKCGHPRCEGGRQC